MKKSNLSILYMTTFLVLTSCAVPTKKIIGPDGTENHLISCGYIETCYEKAREVCLGPYKIVNTSTDTAGSDGMTRSTMSLLVKCNSTASATEVKP
jgi:hypothetical protein